MMRFSLATADVPCKTREMKNPTPCKRKDLGEHTITSRDGKPCRQPLGQVALYAQATGVRRTPKDLVLRNDRKCWRPDILAGRRAILMPPKSKNGGSSEQIPCIILHSYSTIKALGYPGVSRRNHDARSPRCGDWLMAVHFCIGLSFSFPLSFSWEGRLFLSAYVWKSSVRRIAWRFSDWALFHSAYAAGTGPRQTYTLEWLCGGDVGHYVEQLEPGPSSGASTKSLEAQ